MKILKKIAKVVLLVGAVLAFIKLVCRVCRLAIRMEKYDEKAVFTGKSKKYEVEPFEKDSVAAVFSGVDLDFKKASMKGATSNLDILGRFSGISVRVPDAWNVEMDGKSVKSGVSKRCKDNSDVEDAPVLNINYDLKFCGFDVSNPPKEDTPEDIDEVIEEVIEEVVEEVVEEVIEDELEDLDEEED